jgi:hypothetical protein
MCYSSLSRNSAENIKQLVTHLKTDEFNKLAKAAKILLNSSGNPQKLAAKLDTSLFELRYLVKMIQEVENVS